MKKKINLDKIKVTSFVTEIESKSVEGGRFSNGAICNSQEPEFCNWTYNRWCVSNGHCDTQGAFCTAPY